MSDYIPSDVLPKILSMLPPKTLIVCTAVSKKWQSVISSSFFVSVHLRQPREEVLLFRHYPKGLPREVYSLRHPSDLSLLLDLPFPFLPHSKHYFRLLGSAHGLLCLSDDFFAPTGTILLWNPLIRRFLTLPKPLVNESSHGPLITVLGFGSASVPAPDQKVVRLSYLNATEFIDVTPPLVEVFSVNRGAWRPLNAAGLDLCVMEHFWTQSFVSGSVHWLSYKRRERVGFDIWILAFDVEKEVFKKMRMPEGMAEQWPMFMQICAPLKGKLAVADFVAGYCANGNKRTDVWVKADYTDRRSWSKMFTISVEDDYGVLPLPLNLTTPGRLVFANKEHRLISYDPHTKEAQDLGFHGSYEAFYLTSFTPSLVLLDQQSRSQPIPQYRNRKLRLCQDGRSVVEKYNDKDHRGMADFAMGLAKSKFSYSVTRKVTQDDPLPSDWEERI